MHCKIHSSRYCISVFVGFIGIGAMLPQQSAADETVTPLTLSLSGGRVYDVAINALGMGLIGGNYSSGTNNYAAWGTYNSAAVTPMTITGTGGIYSVAINASGMGLIGGLSYAAWGTYNNPNVTPMTTGIGAGSIFGVAINDSGTGLIGGQNASSRAYAAYSTHNNPSVTLFTLVGPAAGSSINGVAINASGAGLIGGRAAATTAYAAWVNTSGGAVTPLTLGFTTGEIYDVAINDSGAGLIGGRTTSTSGPAYAAWCTYNNATVTPMTLGLSGGRINHVAINASGAGLIGGYDTGLNAYAAQSTYNSATVTPLSLNLPNGSIRGVAINASGVGLIGGNNGSNPYAALVSPSGVVTPLTLNLSGQYIRKVAISKAGLIGGSDSSGGYAAWVHEILEAVSAVTPQSIGPYSCAINNQLAAASVLETHFVTQGRPGSSIRRSDEVAELDFANPDEAKLTCSTNQHPKCQTCKKPPDNSIWVAPFGNYVHIKSQDSIPALTNEVAGILAAYDHHFSNFLLGGALGYAFNYIHYSESLGHGKIQEEMACLYGSFEREHFRFNAAVWGGLYQFHNERHALFLATSTSSTHGWILSPHAELATSWNMNGKCSVEPFVMLDWVNSWQHHFTESGASGFNVVMPGYYASLLQSEVGLRFYEDLACPWGRILFEEKLSYINQTPFHFHNVSTFFVDSISAFPIAIGSSKMQNLGGVELLGSFQPRNPSFPYGGFSLQGALGSSYQSYVVSLNIGKKF